LFFENYLGVSLNQGTQKSPTLVGVVIVPVVPAHRSLGGGEVQTI